jgi:hypothetical protein
MIDRSNCMAIDLVQIAVLVVLVRIEFTTRFNVAILSQPLALVSVFV